MIKKFIADFNSTYDILNCPNKIAVSLSGGIDSMALLMLLKEWKAKSGIQIEISAITIDHDLRPESSHETLEISEFCKKHNIFHQTLKWEHEEISSSIQEKARNARYKLLSDFAKNNNLSVILTGHHLGDQIEQILISISQGAGIYSYNIKKFSTINDILFVRPLLEYTKEDLKKYLVSNNIPWWEDSSNKETKYLRNKLRNLSETFLEISDQKRVITSLTNIERAAGSLDHLSDSFIKTHANISELGYAKFNISSFSIEAEEIRFSVLRKLILQIGKQSQDIRLSSIIEVDNSIQTSKSTTLGGCEFLFDGDLCIITREFGRTSPITIAMEENTIWDNRFIVASTIADYKITFIDNIKLSKILKANTNLLNFDQALPRRIKIKILLTLPCIELLEKIVAIPHISYYDSSFKNRDRMINLIK